MPFGTQKALWRAKKLIVGPKNAQNGPFFITESQIGVNLSVLITHQWINISINYPTMNGTLLEPNMCLLGPKRPFWGPKTVKILIFGPKKVRCVPFLTTEGQIGINLSELITQQWMGPFWIPIYDIWDPKGHLEAQKLIKHWFLARKGAHESLMHLQRAKLVLIYQYQLPNNELHPFGSQYVPFRTQKALRRPKNWSNTDFCTLTLTLTLTLTFNLKHTLIFFV